MRTARMVVGAGGVWLLPLLAAIAVGCRQPMLFPHPARHLAPIAEAVGGPGLSDSTRTLLSTRGIADVAAHHPRVAFATLEASIAGDPQPEPGVLLALAELADRVGRGPSIAGMMGDSLIWSRDAAVYSAFCLSGPRCDPATRELARDLQNRAVARCLRLARTSSSHGGWPARLAEAGIIPTATPVDWQTLGFDRIQPADDLIVSRQVERIRQGGIGVPVLAHRRLVGDEKRQWKPYGPNEASFAATAMIRASGASNPGNWRSGPVELVLHDPFRDGAPAVGAGTLPLAHDLTAPLIDRLTESPMRSNGYFVVLSPSDYRGRTGIYTVDPYQAGKIPVLLLQGLWSSPNVWSPMLNALRADPVLRDRFQFWVALYPSGYVPPLAVLELRRAIHELRDRIDPAHRDGALDRMVVLGKSSGGLFAKMLVQSSGADLWNSVFARPFDQVRVDEPLRSDLASMFFYEPEPSIARVIFVSTGHRGSTVASRPGVRMIERWIHAGDPTLLARNRLIADNGLDVFQPAYQEHALTRNDGLNGRSPLMRAIDRTPIAPHVVYHSIIGNNRRTNDPERMTDGVLKYTSTHIEGAASEKVIAMRHASEDNPEVIAEVRRILYAHLAGSR